MNNRTVWNKHPNGKNNDSTTFINFREISLKWDIVSLICTCHYPN